MNLFALCKGNKIKFQCMGNITEVKKSNVK